MKKLLAVVLLFAAACNQSDKGKEKVAPNPIAAAEWYKQFDGKTFDYASTYKSLIDKKDIEVSKKITLADSTVLGIVINYIGIAPDKFYSMGAYANGNATRIKVTAEGKNEMLSSNNEANVLAAVQGMLDLASAERSVFKDVATGNMAAHSDQVVFTIITTSGVLERKVPMGNIAEGMSSMRPLYDAMDEVEKALNENKDAATPK